MVTNSKEYSRQWRLDHPFAHRKYIGRYNSSKKGKDTYFKNHLKQRYGLTVEEYNLRFEQQKGCCAICKRSHTIFKRKLHIDHDHTTGKIRGLLCSSCNTGLGIYEKLHTEFQRYLDGF